MKRTLTGRCPICLAHHGNSNMCVPLEMRTTGIAWFRLYVEELEARVDTLRDNLHAMEEECRSRIRELEAISDATLAAMDETCDGYERHCTCVLLLRRKIHELQSQVEALRTEKTIGATN